MCLCVWEEVWRGLSECVCDHVLGSSSSSICAGWDLHDLHVPDKQLESCLNESLVKEV